MFFREEFPKKNFLECKSLEGWSLRRHDPPSGLLLSFFSLMCGKRKVVVFPSGGGGGESIMVHFRKNFYVAVGRSIKKAEKTENGFLLVRAAINLLGPEISCACQTKNIAAKASLSSRARASWAGLHTRTEKTWY